MSTTKIKELEKLIEEPGAYAASVFGIYARGEEYNDIDVAVFTDGSIDEIVREAAGIFDIQQFSTFSGQSKNTRISVPVTRNILRG